MSLTRGCFIDKNFGMNTKTKDAIENDLSHSMVHYLLTIHKLKENRGFARVTDIAKDLDLTKGTVSTMLNNLKKKGLIEEEEDCKFVVLTKKGHDEVHRILSARTLMFYFLKDFVGVEEETAEADSCQMEHLLSIESSEKFFEFMKKLSCLCEPQVKTNKEKICFNSSLNLCDYKNMHEFVEKQKGDRYL